ncbi:translesion error-prone DNA polymerase V autoproteolytic subunit [Vibrio coralliirubri]|uniref:LexA family protein n=1 Tax=Vibrio coralliirubri TaxID=1516159 RepID=UPI002284C653|nr:translesion error-prone DNA polymerase V autoproteolytic subunit [Vibrio coralliirubri]MCY9861108.1 translesion error-prone DNA polymerase V autoproteolytic subunit [Vibrio coralliirubri]
MKIIPLSASAGISGFESPAAEYMQRSCNLEELLVEHPSSTFLGLANGDSMQGVGIFDGDILIVDRGQEERSGDVVVAAYNGEFVCKVLDKDNGLLISANETYPSIKVSEMDSLIVEGVVTRSIRCHRPTYLFGGD